MKFLIYTLIFLSVGFISCQTTNDIYLVRHAEKSSEPANDPVLTQAGIARAENLKNILKDKNIQTIFSTERVRTMETAKPLSLLINVPIQYYGNDTIRSFMNRVISLKKNALIVGHSNTLLPMLDTLQLSHKKTLIPDNEHDNIFIIHTKNGKTVKVTETTYSALSAPVK